MNRVGRTRVGRNASASAAALAAQPVMPARRPVAAGLPFMALPFFALSALIALFASSPERAFAAGPGEGGGSDAANAKNPPGAIATMPVDEIRPGMTAMARTVFVGTAIDSFPLRILGVLSNVTPGGDLILARAEGDSLEHMGIVQGMSGSPVYIDGRMIGAIAYGWEFSRDPITGITPIGEMLRLLRTESLPARLTSPDVIRAKEPPRPVPERNRRSNAGGDAPLLARTAGGSGATDVTGLSPAGEPRPIMTPVAVSGLDPAAFDVLREPFARHGLALTPTGSGPATLATGGPVAAPAPPLQPGSALGVVLARGDATIAAVGTVTWREGDRILAFGHPLFQAGNVDLPLTAAWVYATIPLSTRSFKMATALEPLGLIIGDRNTGIAGRLGLPADLIPFDVTVGRQGAPPRHFHYEIVRDKELTPLIVSSLALSSMTAGEALGEESFLDVRLEVNLDHRAPLDLRDRFSSTVPPVSLAQGVAHPLEALMQNPFAPPDVKSVALEVTRGASGRYAFIDDARLDENTAEPGDTVNVAVDLHPYRGEVVTRRVRVPLPASVRDGELLIRVADADSAATWDYQRAPSTYAADTFDRMMELLRDSRPHDGFYVQVVRSRGGRVVDGREFPGLPSTVATVMRPGGETSTLRPTRMDVVREIRVPEDFQVIGSRELPLRVLPPGAATRRTR